MWRGIGRGIDRKTGREVLGVFATSKKIMERVDTRIDFFEQNNETEH